MEFLRPLARLRPDSFVARQTTFRASCASYQCHQILKPQPRAPSSIVSRRLFSVSKRLNQDEDRQTQELLNTTKPATLNTTTTTTGPRKANVDSNQEHYKSLGKITGRNSVQAATDDIFGASRPRPSQGAALAQSILDQVSSRDESNVRDLENSIKLRLRPQLGRTRVVDPAFGVDLQTAIMRLEGLCRQNNVRQDERSQKIYVRRGQRRKNLKSSRWRKLFKAGFLEEVDRIQRMRRQGW